VLLDEAHVFCPEQSQSEAQGAVTDLATRGRKRGYGLVMATQRSFPFWGESIAAHRCFVWVGCTTGGFRDLADWRIA